MKSNKCLFNATVFKSALKRFSPYAVLLLIADIIIFPVSIYNGYSKKEPLELTDFASISAVASGFAFVFAGVMALLVFSYLYSPNKCNALHAFPIGRKALFATNFAAGYVLLVLPQIIGFALGIPAIMRVGKDLGDIFLMQAVSIFAESFIYFGIAVLCVMLAGNIFAGAVIYAIVNFAYTVFELVMSSAVKSLGYGLSTGYGIDNVVTNYFSPVVKLIGDKVMLYSLANYRGVLNEQVKENQYYISVLVLVIVTVAVTLAAYALYKKRELECAGDMVAYKVETPIFSVIVSVLGGALAAMLLGTIFSFDVVGNIIAYVVLSLLFYFAARMVLKKTAKVFGVKHFIIWAALCVVTICGVFAIARYETNYVPKTENVKTVTVNSTYNMDITATDEIEKVEKLHRLLIDTRDTNTKSNRTLFSSAIVDYEGEWDYTVSIDYTMKGNRHVQRSYYIYVKNHDEIFDLLGELELKHPPTTVYEQLKDIDFTIKSCEVIDYGNMPENEQIMLNADEFEKFYALCAEDAAQTIVNYQTKSGNTAARNDDLFITFTCAVKDKKDIKKIDNISMSDYVISGATVYSDYEESTTFEITIDGLPKDSKALEYIRNR